MTHTFEQSMVSLHDDWRKLGIADIKQRYVKVTLGRNGKAQYRQKEDFDCQGTRRGGTSVCVELKETQKADKLYINGRGLKLHQAEALVRHGRLGAISLCLWWRWSDYQARMIPWQLVEQTLSGSKRFDWDALAQWRCRECDYLTAWDRRSQ